jgi:protein-disulfide isomerase
LRHLWTILGVVVGVAAAVAAYVTYGGSSRTEAEAPTAVSPAASSQAATAQPSNTSATTQTAQAGTPLDIRPDDHVLGKAEAPVTIIEYGSYTCPHCAHFNNETLPHIESEFIEKGQVRLVFREFLRNQVDLAASLMARCAPQESYFKLVDVLFRSQDSWAFGDKPVDALKQIGRTAGLDPTKMDQCLADKALQERLVAQTQEAIDKLKVEGTPTFFVNGTPYANLPFDDYDEAGTKKPGFGKIIRDLLPKS